MPVVLEDQLADVEALRVDRDRDLDAEVEHIQRRIAARDVEAQKRQEQVSDALDEVVAEYAQARVRLEEAASALTDAKRSASAARAAYENVWNQALRLELDVPIRISPWTVPDDLRESLAGGKA